MDLFSGFARNGEKFDIINRVEKQSVTFVFLSHPVKMTKMRWCVNLTMPKGEVWVEDGEGVPVKSAVLELHGKRVKIREGRGVLSYDDFIKGKHEPAVWLHRRGVPPIPGGLTFA